MAGRSLVTLIGTLALAGCGQASPGNDRPDRLPPVIPYGSAVYDHPKELPRLPQGVVKTGGRLRGGGIAYAADNSLQPAAIWIAKDGQVWEYHLDQEAKYEGQ